MIFTPICYISLTVAKEPNIPYTPLHRSLKKTHIARGGEVVSRMAHNHEIAGAIPAPATKRIAQLFLNTTVTASGLL